MDAFWEIHSDLPREGPGDSASVAKALRIALPLPEQADVLDIACGPGGQTLDLSKLLPKASFVALDAHQPFLDNLEKRATARGVSARIKTICGDMRNMGFPPESFDLIWCEGAVYFVGLEKALRDWRSLLKPGGKFAFTEPVWLRPDPPPRVAACWEEYPHMTSVDAVRSMVESCGYRRLGDFVLPEEAWWANYYAPMERKLPALRDKFKNDRSAMKEIDAAQEAIDVYRNYSDHYGYLFVVLKTR